MHNLSTPISKETLLKAHVALLCASLIWGAAGPIIKYTLNYIPPYIFLFLRFLIVGIVLLPFMYVQINRQKVNPKDYLNLFLLGLFGQASLIILFVSLVYTTALDAVIIGIIASILSVYAGHYFYKEKVSFQLTLGLVLASIGTIVIVLEPLLDGGISPIPVKEHILGNVIALIYNLAWVTYLIWSKMIMGEKSTMLKKSLSSINIKPMTKKYSSTFIVAVTFYVGLFVLLPFALLEYFGVIGFNENLNFSLTALDPKGWFGLMYMAIFSSIVAYMVHQWGLENAHVADVAIYGYLAPIFTVPFAFLLLGEVPNFYMLVGGAIIALGVFVAERKNT